MYDGGTAFPRADGGYSPTQDGMSLRDWFAGQALANMVQRLGTDTNPQNPAIARTVAKSCYALADAMIAQRGKTP